MSAFDTIVRNHIAYPVLPILFILIILYLGKNYIITIRKKVFALVLENVGSEYNNASDDIKRKLFSSLNDIVSKDWKLKNEGRIRVLEIGIGTGANFKYYPKSCELVAVDFNEQVIHTVNKKIKEHPHIRLEKFITAEAEDMKEIEDNSVDAVVGTLLLCSAKNPMTILQEVKRVLVPGGKLFFLEHVHADDGTLLNKIQSALTYTKIWPALFLGCEPNRHTGETIEKAGFSNVNLKKVEVHSNTGGIIPCYRELVKEGGIKGLWRGNGINVLKVAPESALKFMTYEHVKKIIQGDSNRELGIHERFVAGSIAGGVAQTTIYPLEVLKTRLTLRKTGQYRGMFDAAKKIYRTEGYRSFYRGYVPNILGIIPCAGIELAVYETLKKYCARNDQRKEHPGVMEILACAIISHTCAIVATYPLALVKTRLQAQAIQESPKRTTTMGLIRSIVAKEGTFGLYRGITPTFLKAVPAVCISYLVFETCRQALGAKMT